MMQTYNGRVKSGRFYTADGTEVPDCPAAVLIVEGIPKARNSHARAWQKFLKGIENCDEPLEEEFDKVVGERVNFTRELDL